jgi:hypothetical protein
MNIKGRKLKRRMKINLISYWSKKLRSKSLWNPMKRETEKSRNFRGSSRS